MTRTEMDVPVRTATTRRESAAATVIQANRWPLLRVGTLAIMCILVSCGTSGAGAPDHGGQTTAAVQALETAGWTSLGGVPVRRAADGGSANVRSLSCPAPRACFVAATDGHVYANHGTTWTSVFTLDASGSPPLVSCTSVTVCFAGDSNGTTTGFTEPSILPALAAGHNLAGLECWSATQCIAVDSFANAYVLTGTQWSSAIPYGPNDGGDGSTDLNHDAIGFGCSSPTHCLMITAAGLTHVFDGRTFHGDTGGRVAVPSDFAGEQETLSCAADETCATVADGHHLLVLKNGMWVVEGPTLGALSAVSCAPGFCMAVGQNGNGDARAIELSTSGALSATVPTSSATLTVVSCLSATDCTAGAYGNHMWHFGGSPATTPGSSSSPAASFTGVQSTWCGLTIGESKTQVVAAMDAATGSQGTPQDAGSDGDAVKWVSGNDIYFATFAHGNLYVLQTYAGVLGGNSAADLPCDAKRT